MTTKKILNVRIIPDSCFLKEQPGNRFYLPRDQLIQWLLPDIFAYHIVSMDQPAHICICSVRLSSPHLLRKEEFNLMISIENCPQWKAWFPHYQKYGDYDNPMISCYIYNHIDRIVSYPTCALPLIYFRIRYFRYLEEMHRETVPIIPFDEKKFLLVINKSGLDRNLPVIVRFFSTLGTVDHISLYDAEIAHTSCYHSPELLRVFSRYKFILVNENSSCAGYVTEKIFNVFLAKSVPIYHGAPDVTRYFSPEAFLHFDPASDPSVFLERFTRIHSSPSAYLDMIQSPKISETYDDEDFHNKYTNVFLNFFSKRKTFP